MPDKTKDNALTAIYKWRNTVKYKLLFFLPLLFLNFKIEASFKIFFSKKKKPVACKTIINTKTKVEKTNKTISELQNICNHIFNKLEKNYSLKKIVNFIKKKKLGPYDIYRLKTILRLSRLEMFSNYLLENGKENYLNSKEYEVDSKLYNKYNFSYKKGYSAIITTIRTIIKNINKKRYFFSEEQQVLLHKIIINLEKSIK